jgi:hypothetical protein
MPVSTLTSVRGSPRSEGCTMILKVGNLQRTNGVANNRREQNSLRHNKIKVSGSSSLRTSLYIYIICSHFEI